MTLTGCGRGGERQDEARSPASPRAGAALRGSWPGFAARGVSAPAGPPSFHPAPHPPLLIPPRNPSAPPDPAESVRNRWIKFSSLSLSLSPRWLIALL